MIAFGAAFFTLFQTLARSLRPLYAVRHGAVIKLGPLSAPVVLVRRPLLALRAGAGAMSMLSLVASGLLFRGSSAVAASDTLQRLKAEAGPLFSRIMVYYLTITV